MISATTLAYIRATAALFFTDTCRIDVEASTTGEYGEATHSWQLSADAVACRLIQDRTRVGAGGVVGSQETLPDTYKLVVAYNVTIGVNMRVTVTGVTGTFYVTDVETELTDRAFRTATIVRRL